MPHCRRNRVSLTEFREDVLIAAIFIIVIVRGLWLSYAAEKMFSTRTRPFEVTE